MMPKMVDDTACKTMDIYMQTFRTRIILLELVQRRICKFLEIFPLFYPVNTCKLTTISIFEHLSVILKKHTLICQQLRGKECKFKTKSKNKVCIRFNVYDDYDNQIVCVCVCASLRISHAIMAVCLSNFLHIQKISLKVAWLQAMYTGGDNAVLF